jgi:FKBP-type peptidyl-prolyl cis-trans isomerase
VAGNPTPFDASHSTSPFSAAIGASSLPAHLERALRTMKRGERARFLIQPALAFGPGGDPNRGVPGDADLEYEIALLGLAEVTKLAGGSITKKVITTPIRTHGS